MGCPVDYRGEIIQQRDVYWNIDKQRWETSNWVDKVNTCRFIYLQERLPNRLFTVNFTINHSAAFEIDFLTGTVAFMTDNDNRSYSRESFVGPRDIVWYPGIQGNGGRDLWNHAVTRKTFQTNDLKADPNGDVFKIFAVKTGRGYLKRDTKRERHRERFTIEDPQSSSSDYRLDLFGIDRKSAGIYADLIMKELNKNKGEVEERMKSDRTFQSLMIALRTRPHRRGFTSWSIRTLIFGNYGNDNEFKSSEFKDLFDAVNSHHDYILSTS